MRHSRQIIDQPLLEEKADDVVHAIMLRLGCGTAVEAGGGRARFHDGADNAHDRLQPGVRERGVVYGSKQNVFAKLLGL